MGKIQVCLDLVVAVLKRGEWCFPLAQSIFSSLFKPTGGPIQQHSICLRLHALADTAR